MTNETAFWIYGALVSIYAFLTIVRVILYVFKSWREKYGKPED